MQAMVGISSKLYEAIKGIGGTSNIREELIENEILSEDEILSCSQNKIEGKLSIAISQKFNQVKKIMKESDFYCCFIFDDDIETNFKVLR